MVRGLVDRGHEVAVFHRGKAPVSFPTAALREFEAEVVIDLILSPVANDSETQTSWLSSRTCREPGMSDKIFDPHREFFQTRERRTAMKGTRHSEEQVIAILKQGEAGVATAELCRQHGISEQTYYRWKAKYGGMDSGEAKRLKQLEDENGKLKHVVADLTLDNRALKDVLSKNW